MGVGGLGAEALYGEVGFVPGVAGDFDEGDKNCGWCRVGHIGCDE